MRRKRVGIEARVFKVFQGSTIFIQKIKLLNLSEAFSAKKYFAMFVLIAIFPLVYCLLGAYSGFPLRAQNFDKSALQNESLVLFLELNLTDVEQFNFFVPNDQQVNTYNIFMVLNNFCF